MKEKIKFLLLIFVLFLFLSPISNADARSGCCSHHGGVCGCSCCDGTSLSATCAPYYPQCSTPKAAPTPSPSPTPAAVNTPSVPTNTGNQQAASVNSNNYLAQAAQENNEDFPWGWIIGLGIAGVIGFSIYKGFKK